MTPTAFRPSCRHYWGFWTRVHVDLPELHILHQEFLLRQPYRSVKTQCDLLVGRLTQDPLTSMPDLDVIQEACIAHILETLHAPK